MQDAAAELLATPGFIERLRSGDREAVGIFFRECAGEMMEFLKKTRQRHGCPEQEWDDAIQDVFVRFIRKPPKLQTHRPVLPYLKTCALRQARDRVKAARAKRKHESFASIEREITTPMPKGIGHDLEVAEIVAMIEAKVDGMKLTDQEAIRAFMESDPNRHVATLAERAGIEVGAAQMRFTRAIKRLRAEMDSGRQTNGGAA